MTGPFAETMNASLALVVGVVGVAMVFGAVDLLRQPGWAWKAAGEPKLVCLALVVLLPGVGLAIYVIGARPKVVAITTHGRAASLPFERFADRADTAVESDRAIQALARPGPRGSFGGPLNRPVTVTQAPTLATAGAGGDAAFFADPDLVPVGGAAGSSGTAGAAPAPVAVEVVTDPPPESSIRIPTQAGRPYNPRQRASIDEGPLRAPSLAAVAAEIAAGAYLEDPVPGDAAAVPRAVPQPVISGSPMGGMSTMLAPRVGTTAPDIFRPHPESVTPIAGTAPVTTAPLATMAARWMADPTGRHEYRYWDGGHWTENVYDAGVESLDPVTG